MKLKLVAKKQEVTGVFTFIFEPEERLEWKAGQYLRYTIKNPASDERGESRFFTIASAPFEKQIQLTTRISNEQSSTFKTDLFKLEIEDEVDATGPSGSFTVEDVFISEGKRLCFIAGGIGITPFRAILRDLVSRDAPINVELLYANRDAQIPFKEELEEIAKTQPNFKIHYFIADKRIDGKAIKELFSNLSNYIFYLSGPEPMVEGIKKTLEDELKVQGSQIKTDFFPGYTAI